MALGYAALGEKEQAVGYLKAAVDTHDGLLDRVYTDPGMDPLRSDPRFQEILRRLNFPP